MNQNKQTNKKNLNVIFDTNAYRNLVHGLSGEEVVSLILKVKTFESKALMFPILSGITAMELLSHLSDPLDKGFNDCKLSVIAASRHAVHGNQFSFVPHITLHLQLIVFGKLNPVDENGNMIIAQLVEQIGASDADMKIVRYNQQLTEINRLVNLHEDDFIANTYNSIIGYDEKATDWILLKDDKPKRDRILRFLRTKEDTVLRDFAKGYFDKTVRGSPHFNIRSTPDLILVEIEKSFRTAFILHLKLLERLIVTGYDMSGNKKNRANTIWDIYQLFFVNDQTFNGRKTIFVTDEKWLIDVGRDAGFVDNIITLKNYLDMIGL
jgi:hypothetical protein